MTWAEHHRTSRTLAESAHDCAERGERADARARFTEAAEAEERALACVNPESEPRTFGATSVSATALWYKAGEFERARQVAQRALQMPTLARFARDQLDELLENMSPRRRVTRASLWTAGVSTTVLVAVAAIIWWRLPGAQAEVYSTRIGEVRSIKLEDGSEALLNTRTELRLVDVRDPRKVELVAGEALFNVRHDPAHTFIVDLGDSEIRVLGTRFNVYRRPAGEVEVTVVEGQVRVLGHDTYGDWVSYMSAGQRLAYRADGPAPKPRQITNVETVVSWQSHEIRVPSEGMPLKQIADELMRYTDKRIVIRDSGAADLVIGSAGVSLPTNDVPGALDRLKSLGVITWSERNGAYVIELASGAANRR